MIQTIIITINERMKLDSNYPNQAFALTTKLFSHWNPAKLSNPYIHSYQYPMAFTGTKSQASACKEAVSAGFKLIPCKAELGLLQLLTSTN